MRRTWLFSSGITAVSGLGCAGKMGNVKGKLFFNNKPALLLLTAFGLLFPLSLSASELSVFPQLRPSDTQHFSTNDYTSQVASNSNFGSTDESTGVEISSLAIPTAVSEAFALQRSAVVEAIEAILPVESKDKKGISESTRALIEVYMANKFAPIWLEGQRVKESAKAIILLMRDSEYEGFFNHEFLPPDLIARVREADDVELGRLDILISSAVLDFADRILNGNLPPSRISSDISYDSETFDSRELLLNLSVAVEPGLIIEQLQPKDKRFAMLKKRLAVLVDRLKKVERREGNGSAGDTSLDYTMLDEQSETENSNELPRLVALEAGISRIPTARPKYTPFITLAREQVSELKSEGDNVSINFLKDEIAQIVVNMEQWRWLPRELGEHRVEVNIPQFRLQIYSNGRETYNGVVVVGKTTNKTPIFSDEIDHLVVNPSWYVPQSIIANEYLPAARANPNAISRQGLEVAVRQNGRFVTVNSSSVNWSSVSAKDIQLRQPPSERNALGKIKFMFPNKYAVYLHDTPSKSLFEKSYRAYSHGCVRVQNPLLFAQYLLEKDSGVSVEDIKPYLKTKRESRVNLKKSIPVHLVYFTLTFDEKGNAMSFGDVYGYHQTARKLLGI